jgi:hypothetical protein
VRPRVYAAHPMTSYGTEHERTCLDTLAALLRGVEIIDPATRYRTNAGWLRAWPRLLSTLSGLVVFADETGTVGAGCLREVVDAVAAGLPVLMLDDDHHLCELAALDLLPSDIPSRTHAAWPVAGEHVTWHIRAGSLACDVGRSLARVRVRGETSPTCARRRGSPSRVA